MAALYGLNRWRASARWLLLAGALLFAIACWLLVYKIGAALVFAL
jgi:hypothetical protein